ncbi:gliding motility-associated C-terminal domain-containing protein [Algoriphagus sp. CAU 1675]|uniref:gliding motility-associated C-terminal domain-containing protein n=1 Tax=Algoriphagus sp. CAU 1675 TaxID=3032597 RepID=UPI0023DAC10B|nr:gliding motility-associated C-terminal domain-containing protein [Algoriphagus sp. CAU 1675]MDF2157514.1 gliding motility-associated C-terminal domain-containing protein [Algoriphagus sp. CAU 1675]
MKSKLHSIRVQIFFTFLFLFSLFGIQFFAISQGFNNNEWIFGYCETSTDNNYLSFGKGGTATVQTLPSTVLIGKDNNAIAIDPISGQPLFLTNGVLVYDYSNDPIQGSAPGLNGDLDGRQKVATGFLEYDPEGNKLFYIFYISPAGQLQYAVVDMNAPGQASGNEPPLGEVTSKDVTIGSASGAILVVKTPSSPSYLISFDGGNLISRRLEATEGSFTETDNQGIPFTPKAIVFDESRGQLILIPENPNEDILVLDFDTSNGSFGTPRPITQSGGIDAIEGAAFSPDGSFIYFSRGNQLFRVPTSNLTAAPEAIPLDSSLHAVYDVKTGPDGQLYYIYEETAGGPQLIGRVPNPDEADLSLLTVEEDPFTGTDFCGTIFPVFAPNANISAQVDFTWSPDEPCANNPVQLTSEITPANYQPVSFSWEFDPPLTDADGNPIDADYSEEHFLVPADAAQNQNISVTLTVTFADGSTDTVSKNIPLSENNLEANFTPSDTTLCEGQCVDIGALLEAQSTAGQQDGEAPSGSGDQYEYFWSNYRDEGWTNRQENEVCLPGLYWVMVREPGSSCYAYAEIRVQIWDLEDQSNNIWYFGDGAGLDFNPDPNDPDAPTPRPISQPHPQNIPAGTTTISDATGEVLFYSDGQSVWDLNGNLMENGDNIGGDNASSQSVIAVPVPQEQTLFYLFTTQATASGTNEVKFSLVDIKAENPSGIGNVVSKDNFLFSPSTEQSAGFNAGDTTWVLFHELGNNTFRAYPVSSQGIGQAVLSSVGSNHDYNSGIGSMKFSPDGSKVAVTISEGGCNRLEIFDFDQDTGEMTEYALLDLGCDGEVYGLEFSDSGERVLVSYRNGGPGVEEFIIQAVENDDPDAATCPACFGNANTRPQIEQCILTTRNNISGTSGLDLGALQIGPDGQIYVAVVGDSRIGQINVGTGCTTSSAFTQDAVEPMPGTTNLGLPSFVQNSGSSIPEPALAVPARLCLDPDLGAGALLEGGGEPDIDSYFWTITRDDGTVIQNNFGGPGEEFQTLDQAFDEPGIYTVELHVDRCATADYYVATAEIQVDAPPTLTLVDDATLCSGTPVTLTAIDGYDPAEGLYDFVWTNAAGQVFGDQNSNSITVDEESIYSVTVSYRIPDGLSDDEALLYATCPSTAEVFVGPAFEFDLTQTATEVCYEETSVTFAPNTPISGEWYYELNGDPNRVFLGEFFELELWINTLPGPGQYEIIFITEDPILTGCIIEKRLDLLVNELPLLTALQTTPAADCATPDGSFEITMQSDAISVTVQETGQVFSNANAGDVIPVSGLLPGTYTLEAANSNGCIYIASVNVENDNPPADFEYTVSSTDETCNANGVEPGLITITFTNGNPQTGTYRIVRQRDGQEFTGPLPNASSFDIQVPYGDYTVEILDPNSCSIPNADILTIAQKFQVLFSVPTDFIACESYTFSPDSQQELTYLLSNSSGTEIQPDGDGNYTLTQSGIYTMRGEDPTGVNCPMEIQMNIVVTEPIDFDLAGPFIDCQAGIRYEAVVNNVDPANVVYLWRDEFGIIVGRQPFFIPSRDGDYSLEVQPTIGGLCSTPEIPFSAEILDENVDVELDVAPFCLGQSSTSITVVADMAQVATIEWYSVQGGTRTRIPDFDDLPIIDVSNEGTYEVLLRSAAGCEMGRASGEVIQSTIIPPVVETGFTICALEGVTTTLRPGQYDNYSWVLNGVEVSQDSVFTPTEPGIYELTVSDNLGCEYVETVEVFEDCDLKVSFPSGMVLNDPSRNFILYANEYIDDVEVFIFNRWGELIFYCTHENIEPAQEFCPWDGKMDGSFVPIGTYAVLVRFTSRDQNKTQQITKAITIIQ